MELVRIKKLSFSGHILYLSLGGSVCGFLYSISVIMYSMISSQALPTKSIGEIIGFILGIVVSGAIAGVVTGVFSYKLLNRILRSDYFTIMGSVEK